MEVTCRAEFCGAIISSNDVMAEKQIKSAPGHLVVLYRCSVCSAADRIIVRADDWYGRIEPELDDVAVRGARIMEEFILDLGLFDTVAELEALWASYRSPAPLEGVVCGCRSCEGGLL